MESVRLIQGRCVCESELADIRGLLDTHRCWSRRRISVELARVWNWRTATGQLKDMAARSLLLKLEQRGWINLPPCQRKVYPRVPRVFAPGNEPPSRHRLPGRWRVSCLCAWR